jgi:CBS domain-containing protein
MQHLTDADRSGDDSGLPVRLIMSRPLLVDEHASLADVAACMLDHDAAVALVVDGAGRLRGIITENEFAARATAIPFSAVYSAQVFDEPLSMARVEQIYQRAARTKRARQAMHAPGAWVREDDSVYTAISRMAEKDLAAIPVLRDDHPVGIVTRRDLLKLIVWDGAQE